MALDWIACNWKQLIGLMQEKWGKLTYNDLVGAAGDRERIVALLQEHYGYEKARAETELNAFTRLQSDATQTEVGQYAPSLKS